MLVILYLPLSGVENWLLFQAFAYLELARGRRMRILFREQIVTPTRLSHPRRNRLSPCTRFSSSRLQADVDAD